MKQNKSIAWNIFVFVFFALLIATFAFSVYKFTRHADPTEIIIYSAENYAAGKPVSIILFARNAAEQTPLTDQKIDLFVNGKAIPSITTKDDGTALLVLEKYPQNLMIEARIGERVVKKYIGVGKYKDDLSKVLKKVELKTKPGIQLKTDKSFYAPGETINATIKSKLPAKTKIETKTSLTLKVLVRGSMFGDEYIRQQVHYKNIKGSIDASGNFNFQLKLPENFKRIDFAKEDSICELSISTPSGLKFKKKITITTRPVRIKYLPEYSKFLAGYSNNIYVFVGDPVGKPLIATVKLDKESSKTDKNGLARLEIPLKYGECKESYITAIVEDGGETKLNVEFRYAKYSDAFILKTDKLIYSSGNTMFLDIFSESSVGEIFINIRKDRKSLKFFPFELTDDKVRYIFNIPDDMFGLVQIHAYKIMTDGKVIKDSRIIQVNRDGQKKYFSSPSEMVRARFERTGTLENVELETSTCQPYNLRDKRFAKKRKAYGEVMFSILLPILFAIFLLLLIYFIRLWFYHDGSNSYLIISSKLRKQTRNNMFFGILGFVILSFIFLLSFGTIMTIETPDALPVDVSSQYIIIIVSIVAYILILIAMIRRSFCIRNILLKEPSGKDGYRVKKSIFLLPYLLFIFILFQHSWIIALHFLRGIESYSLLVWAFQGLAIIWVFCAYKIRAFYYTQAEYDNMLKAPEAGLRYVAGLGAGIGAYQYPFYKIWLFCGLFYWGILVFVYLCIVIIIISLFLPLTRIIEKLA